MKSNLQSVDANCGILPTYKAIINDENEGIFVISLVSMPATEVNWVTFNANELREHFAIVDNDEHILAGVVMTADTPIYRIAPDGQEYYIVFSKDVIKEMAEKMLSDNTFNNIDIQHNGEILPQGMVKLVELFITDERKGINPNYIDVPEGSLMANYKIYDEQLWNEIKNGKLNGFSLEGIFSSIRLVEPKNNKYTNTMNKVKETLRKLLISLGEIETDKGVLSYEGEYFEVGTEVMLNDEPAPNGEYVLDDNKTAVVKDGVIVEIIETEKLEETIIENVPDEDTSQDISPIIDELKNRIDEHETLLNELNERINSLNDLIKELSENTVVESVENVDLSSTFKKVKNKAIEMASYIKK